MKTLILRLKRFLREKRITALLFFFFVFYLILILKYISFNHLLADWFLGIYSALITFYILSRFVFSYFYQDVPCDGYEPTISFVVPAYNEGKAIARTIARIYEIDYPASKVEVITVNDGSKDDTLKVMQAVQKLHPSLQIIDWQVNRGKRDGMAAGAKAAQGEILVFVDSDSFIQPDSIRYLVNHFADPKVGAVAGHAEVYNEDVNMLTRMQAVRYFISFRVFKATESIFNTVTCCSGCFAAYRRTAVMEIIDAWLNQKFLGVRCTYGDDRSLTNFLIKQGYKLTYSREAIAHTIVPSTMKSFWKQQLRWKKSWSRECFIASGMLWKRHLLMSIGFYVSVILSLMAPLVVARALFWYTWHFHQIPFYYLIGLFLISFLYGLYYYYYTGKKFWFYGVIFTWFYTLILVWQLPYAILTLRDSKWGTR